MGVPDVISYFDDFDEPENEFRFLSNFFVGTPIHFGKYVALTGEHLFQAMKARDGFHFRKILAAATPGEAKAEGRHLLGLRPDWERVKYDVMRVVLAHKFTLKRPEGGMLLDTRDALLVEGTYWKDRVWGVELTRTDDADPGAGWQTAPGRNWLGVLLMARRAELHAELAGVPAFDYAETINFIRYRPATPDV
jgi:ribA/ribD-fused uncharacterized protein